MYNFDDIRILTGDSGVIVGEDIVVYQSEDVLRDNLASVGLSMPSEGIYTVPNFLEHLSTGNARGHLQVSPYRLAYDLLYIAMQVGEYSNIRGVAKLELLERLAHRLDDEQ